MAGFDAELYLRVTGESGLLRGGDPHNALSSPILEAATALVAVGAIGAEAAQAVVDDYGLALALRNQGHLQHRRMMGLHRRAAASASPPVLHPRRVVRCDRVLEQPAGTMHIHSASLADDSTSLAVTFRPTPSPQQPLRRVGGMVMLSMGGGAGSGGPGAVTLTDDRGTTTSADFNGGGSDSEWRGAFLADSPLARDTAWIEVDGERLELVDEALGIEVTVEELPDENAALRHLWWRVATPRHFHAPTESLEVEIDALVAAGALSAEDPALAEVRAVLAAMGHGGSGSRGLPEPWRSLLARRGRANGPTGVVPIGAVSPEFDGVTVAVVILHSTEEGFEVEFEVVPDVGMRSPFESTVDEKQVAWWAADDRGNRYLGHLNGWSGGGGRGEGTVEFWPAIDPKAARLDLMPTTAKARAVVGVPLPWAAGP